ncbi:MAG: hypothetical protein P8Y34_09635 [Anaerolineales bacterium]
MGKRTNEEWLTDLRGPDKDKAIEDLRKTLKKGLIYALSSRIDTDLEARVEDFVQDAILRPSLKCAASAGKTSPSRSSFRRTAAILPRWYWLTPALIRKNKLPRLHFWK